MDSKETDRIPEDDPAGFQVPQLRVPNPNAKVIEMIPNETDRLPDGSELDLESLVEFADNPEPRCACVLLLDTSGSMHGAPIEALNEGVSTYIDTLRDDALASLRVETAIVSFDSGVNLEQDFATAEAVSSVSLKAWGATDTASGVNRALDMIDERKNVYREAGIAYYRPWVILITDGAATSGADQMRAASERVHQAEEAKHVAFFCVGVEGALMDELNELGPRAALPLRGLAFNEFFQWLSASMTAVSSSRVDEELALPSPEGWAKL